MPNDRTLKARIMKADENTVFFRSDFPQYHTESVGRVLSAMTAEGLLIRLAPGIYAKPRTSRFGPVLPSVITVVEAIAKRDNAQILPSGTVALNALGLSSQVPDSYSFITTGSARVIMIGANRVILKRGVPRNFIYKSKLIALLVQALRELGENNVGEAELAQIRELVSNETDYQTLTGDVQLMPEWMKRLVKPMINT